MPRPRQLARLWDALWRNEINSPKNQLLQSPTPDPSPVGRGVICFVTKNRFIMRRIAMIGIVLLVISVPFQWLYLGNYVVSAASTLIAIYGILRYFNKLA